MTEPTLEEVLKIIGKYPTEDDYIMDSYDADLYNGEWRDNSIELSDYYQECSSIYKEYLFNKHG